MPQPLVFLLATVGLWVSSESHMESGISSHDPMAGPHMEYARTVVIAGDTCHDGAVYMPVLYQVMALHSFPSLSEP